MSGAPRLDGRVALVSGAGGGIGIALLRALADAGARVVGFDIRPAPAAAAPHVAGWLEGDVGCDATVSRALAEIRERHSRLDLLVHAAGIARDRVLWKLAPEDWNLVLQVNLGGAFLLMRHAVPLMREGGGGRIVLLGSINGSRGKFGQTAYAASKAGLIGLAKSAARETGRFGVRVNVVEPGLVNTAMAAEMPDEAREAAVAETLLGRMAEPEEIAEAVLFLCGSGAAHITGQVLRVDGGQYL